MTTRTIPTTINSIGISEIKAFLQANHKLCVDDQDYFGHSMLLAWAADAEFQLAEGNPATIEIRSFDSASGAAVTYTVSDAGIDSAKVETRIYWAPGKTQSAIELPADWLADNLDWIAEKLGCDASEVNSCDTGQMDFYGVALETDFFQNPRRG